MLYTSSTPSLAMLEMMVHGIQAREEYCLATIEIPEDDILTLNENELPPGWNKYPAPFELRTIGDLFIRENKFLTLKVPSAVMSMESNLLINPRHRNFKKVILADSRRILMDNRFML